MQDKRKYNPAFVSGYPSLPGHQFYDPTKVDFRKTQLMGVKDGACQERGTEKVDIDQDFLRTMQTGTPLAYDTAMLTKKQPINEAIPTNAPSWLKHDRQVLRFHAFFQEAVHENPLENYRLRKCAVYYYLDDGTIYVTEPKQENSGMPQGVLIKKHKIPKGQGEFYGDMDFNVGIDITFYGKVFHLYGCDDFTRRYYTEQGVTLNANEGEPEDAFAKDRRTRNIKYIPEDQAEYKEYANAALSGGKANKNLQQYLENDRKVLQFDVLWSNEQGADVCYKINFFLADNTLEVKEVKESNSGKDPFPLLLRRQKLAKNPILSHTPGMQTKKEEFYGPEDFLIGNTINIFNRKCTIFGCDTFTTQYYADVYGVEQKSVEMKKKVTIVSQERTPAWNGFGSEEDSLRNVKSLNPRPKQKNIKQAFAMDKYILRFEATLISPNKDDQLRRFLISYFCGDDTILIFETADKNSGFQNGKFLERRVHKHPYQERNYHYTDFIIGAAVFVNGFKFRLTRGDEFTYKFMLGRPEEYPMSNISSVMEKIKKYGKRFPSADEYAIHLLRELDRNGDGVIDSAELFNGLKRIGINLEPQEEFTLMRTFDKNGDYKISMEEFYNTLSSL